MAPEKHARWIIIHDKDMLYERFYNSQEKRDKLYKYYNKFYTSDDVLIFKRMPKYD